MTNTLIERSRSAIGNVLPEGRLKDFLRSLLHRHYDPLDDLITEARLLENGSLLVQLNVGVKFHIPPDNQMIQEWIVHLLRRYRSRYGKPHVLAEIEGIGYFGTLWRGLWNQYVDDTYERDYKCKKGDIVVDIGAHIGTFTVKAARAVANEGMVIAIEPDMTNLRFLGKNIRENGLRNVLIVQKGVWSTKDRLELSTRRTTGTHSFLHRKDDNGFVKVEVDTLDNILGELGVRRVDFTKMDIEGAEIEALKGMKETLRNNDVKLAIAAYHSTEGKEETYRTIAPWLKRDGFQVTVKRGMVYARKCNKLQRGVQQ